jgi:hypothetical protein
MSKANNPTEDTDLRAIQVAFLAALEQGEAPAPWLRRYPQHARALTDLALAATVPVPEPTQAEVARTADILRAALTQHATRNTQPVRLGERVKALGLKMADVAAQVRLTSDILFKIDRRIIPVETVPARLLDQLAGILDCSATALRAGLAGRAPQTAGAMYHAKQQPTTGQQSFADAVRASVSLAEADRAYWLDEE